MGGDRYLNTDGDSLMDELSVEHHVFDRIELNCGFRYSDEVSRTCRVRKRDLLGELANESFYRLSLSLWGKNDKKEMSATIRVPASWWQMFKMDRRDKRARQLDRLKEKGRRRGSFWWWPWRLYVIVFCKVLLFVSKFLDKYWPIVMVDKEQKCVADVSQVYPESQIGLDVLGSPRLMIDNVKGLYSSRSYKW